MLLPSGQSGDEGEEKQSISPRMGPPESSLPPTPASVPPSPSQRKALFKKNMEDGMDK